MGVEVGDVCGRNGRGYRIQPLLITCLLPFFSVFQPSAKEQRKGIPAGAIQPTKPEVKATHTFPKKTAKSTRVRIERTSFITNPLPARLEGHKINYQPLDREMRERVQLGDDALI